MNQSIATEIADGYNALCGDGGAVITERDVVVVEGPDAARYLQGQLSQDVVAMPSDQAWSFLLQPTGKVSAWLRVHRIDAEQYVLETDLGWGEVVVSRLQRFLLRTKAHISSPNRHALLQTRWNSTHRRLGGEESGNVLFASAVGPNVAGVDLLSLGDSEAMQWEHRSDLVPAESLARYRIVHGIPQMGSDLNEESIPGEAGAWVIDASVSFTKGCYTGQELVARIDSRGNNVPHPLRVLVLDSNSSQDDEVWLDGHLVGAITSSAPALGDELPPVAIARVGRAVVPGSRVTVGPDQSSAQVVEPGTVL